MRLKKILSAVIAMTVFTGGILALAPAVDAGTLTQVSYKSEGGVSGGVKQEGKKVTLNLIDTSKVTKKTTTSGSSNTKKTNTKKTNTTTPGPTTKTEKDTEIRTTKDIPVETTITRAEPIRLVHEVPVGVYGPYDPKKVSAHIGSDGKLYIVRDELKEAEETVKDNLTSENLFRLSMVSVSCNRFMPKTVDGECYDTLTTVNPPTISKEGTPANQVVDPEYTVNWQANIINQSSGDTRTLYSGSSRLQMTIVFDKAGKYRIVADPVSNKGNVNWNGGRRVFEIEIEEDDVGKLIPFPSGGGPGGGNPSSGNSDKDVFLSGGGAVQGNKYNPDNASKSGSGDRDWSWRSNGARIKEVSR